MGITISYRGRLADLSRIEDFEDRLVDFALDVGGLARIWRTHDDDDPQRMVRGVILEIAPGMESTSLLLSPEGCLINLTEVEDAERGRLTEPPWCFTKTQFGPLEGHVVLVEMLAALQKEFLPGLEVRDEGGYWEKRDLDELKRRLGDNQRAIEAMTKGLQQYGISREAAEDPEILTRHIERVAARVHRILQRPSEHPPLTFSESDDPAIDPDAVEAEWDELYKHNRRRQEQMQRAIEERLSQGEDVESAFENAMNDMGLGDLEGEDEDADGQKPFDDAMGEGEEESWSSDEESDPFEAAEREKHPLLERASDFYMRLHEVLRGVDERHAAALDSLHSGAGDMVGGLAQALSGRDAEDDDPNWYGLRVVQLKRALRGAAFARGGLFPLRGAVDDEKLAALHEAVDQLYRDIYQELSELRGKYRKEE